MTENNTGGITKNGALITAIKGAMRTLIKVVRPVLRDLLTAMKRAGRVLKHLRESRKRADVQTVTIGVRVQPYVDTNRTVYTLPPQVTDRRPAVSHRLNY